MNSLDHIIVYVDDFGTPKKAVGPFTEQGAKVHVEEEHPNYVKLEDGTYLSSIGAACKIMELE